MATSIAPEQRIVWARRRTRTPSRFTSDVRQRTRARSLAGRYGAPCGGWRRDRRSPRRLCARPARTWVAVHETPASRAAAAPCRRSAARAAARSAASRPSPPSSTIGLRGYMAVGEAFHSPRAETRLESVPRVSLVTLGKGGIDAKNRNALRGCHDIDSDDRVRRGAARR
jgi:hypothetical protein